MCINYTAFSISGMLIVYIVPGHTYVYVFCFVFFLRENNISGHGHVNIDIGYHIRHHENVAGI